MMYAVVNQVRIQPGKADEGLGIWHSRVVPSLKQQRGFKGLVLLLNREENRGMSVLLWQSEADLQAAMDTDFAARMQELLQPVLAGPPERGKYEVIIHEDL
jgi:heme-degrading monooxygenase HmoA